MGTGGKVYFWQGCWNTGSMYESAYLPVCRGACTKAPLVPHPVEPSALLPLRRFVAMSRQQLDGVFEDTPKLLFEGSAVWEQVRAVHGGVR
jgi:hypothetical protein